MRARPPEITLPPPARTGMLGNDGKLKWMCSGAEKVPTI
jgi:hypothetical protein